MSAFAAVLLCLCLQASYAFSLQPCGSIHCQHGRCENSTCVCDPCYRGKDCSVPASAAPSFANPETEVTIPESSASGGQQVATVKAVDADAAGCGTTNCDCGVVRYGIVAGGENFVVGADTGGVQVAPGRSLQPGRYVVRVAASNAGDFASSSSVAAVVVNVEKELSRKRRAGVSPPTNVTFNYTQIYPTENRTHLKMGEKLTFRVTIHFPAGLTNMNMELFSPDSETLAVIMICDAQITHVGPRVSLNRETVMSRATHEGKNGTKWPYVRYVLPFGDVVTDGTAGTNENDFAVIVEYDAVFLYNEFVTAETEYWVSAGAEYNNESVIWIGQTSFKADMDQTNITSAVDSLSINIEGDDSVYAGAVSMYSLNISVPYLYSNFTVDVFGPLNNSELLSLCGVYAKQGSGSGFGCVPTSQWPYEFQVFKQRPQYLSYYRSTLSFSATKFTNKAYRMPGTTSSDHQVSLQFALVTNSSAPIGSSSYIGATVDFGSQVVTGYKTVTVAAGTGSPPGTNVTTTDPTISMQRVGPGTLAPKSGTMYELTIDTVPGTRFDYEIQALMPSNDSLARMRVCAINVTYAGRNLPCLGLFKDTVSTTFQRLYGNGSVPEDQHDYAFIRLPGLINTGTVATDQDPLANRIVVRMVAVANNHSLNVPGGSAYVTMGVTYADKQWVSVSPVNFTDAMNISSLPNASLPAVSMSYLVGDNVFNIGETAVVEVVTSLQRGVTYEPMDFEFIAPFQNGSAVMSVCGFHVLHVGKNVGCSDINALKGGIRLTSKANSSVYDKAVFSLGTISNVGPESGALDDDDRIKLRFKVKMLQHPAHANGTIYHLSYGFQFSNDQIWIGQLTAMLQDPAVPVAALAADKRPLVMFEKMAVTTYADDVVSELLLVKVAPGSQSRYWLSVEPPAFASVCTVTVSFVGRNVSCPNDTEIRASAERTPFDTLGKELLTKNATFQLGYLLNSGDGALTTEKVADDNTLALKVVLKVAKDASGSGVLKVTVGHEQGAAETPVSQTVTVAAGSRTFAASNNTPTFVLSLLPLMDGMNETLVYGPGQAFRAALNVSTPAGVDSKVKIQFVSPVNTENQLDICSVRITRVGQNLPCVVPWNDVGAITSRNLSLSSDFGTVDLGTVCNVGAGQAAEDNEMQVEVLGRVWANTTALADGQLPLSCVVFVDDQQIFVQIMNLTVSATQQPPYYFRNSTELAASFNDTTEILATVGSDVEIALNVEVPEFISSSFRIDLRNAEINSTAWAVVNRVNITRSGVNLICLSNEPYQLQLNSSQGTGQMDVGSLMVYTIQNVGITTLSGSPNPPADRNNFTVVFNVKVADPLEAENGTKFQVSGGLQLLDRIVIALRDITVLRTGAEAPDAEVQVDVQTTAGHLHTPGDPVTICVNVTSAANASAEMQQPVFFFHSPPYIQFVAFVNVTYLSGVITYEPMANAGMKFTFNSSIFMKETALFCFTVALKPNTTLPGGRETANATTAYEMTFKMHTRANNPASSKWVRKAGSVHFMVKTDTVPASSCSADLGMNDTSVIKDCQISSFMDPFIGYESNKIRPNAAGWMPHVRGSDYGNLRYATVLFGKLTYVTRISLYASGANKPTCINVYKTKDGRAFSVHQLQIMISAFYDGHIANVSLSKPLLGRGIRIGICDTENGSDSEVVVKFDLNGCDYTDPDYFTFDPCTRRPYDAGMCGRHYLVSEDNSTIFYCDYVVTNTQELSGMSKCFKANTANPRSWQYLGPSVGHIIAYQPSRNRLFGLAQGCAGSRDADRSYVVSDDGGSTWKVTNPQAYIGMRGSPLSGTVVLSKPVDWKLDSGFQPGVSGVGCDKFAAGNWRLCYDGIYHTTDMVVSWNACCLR